MRGLLFDVNVDGLSRYIRFRLEVARLWDLIAGCGIEFTTMAAVGCAQDIADRELWQFCQAQQWVLLTDNRNEEAPSSLEAVLKDSWQEGALPVLTLSDKARFERDSAYADRVALSLAEILFGIKEEGGYRTTPRIWLPL